jgi:hypothetical protein
MPPSPRGLARHWRLVHEAERLGSACKDGQEFKATVRVVEKWCWRAKATGTMDDTPRAGIPRAPLASREATLLMKEGVKSCPDFCGGVYIIVSTWTFTVVNVNVSEVTYRGELSVSINICGSLHVKT